MFKRFALLLVSLIGMIGLSATPAMAGAGPANCSNVTRASLHRLGAADSGCGFVDPCEGSNVFASFYGFNQMGGGQAWAYDKQGNLLNWQLGDKAAPVNLSTTSMRRFEFLNWSSALNTTVLNVSYGWRASVENQDVYGYGNVPSVHVGRYLFRARWHGMKRTLTSGFICGKNANYGPLPYYGGGLG